MASQSVVTLLSALFFASIIGVTIAYPPIVRDVLENDNDNPLQIAKLLSHFSSQPQLQQDDNKEIEVSIIDFPFEYLLKRNHNIYVPIYLSISFRKEHNHLVHGVVNVAVRVHNSALGVESAAVKVHNLVLGVANDQIGLNWSGLN